MRRHHSRRIRLARAGHGERIGHDDFEMCRCSGSRDSSSAETSAREAGDTPKFCRPKRNARLAWGCRPRSRSGRCNRMSASTSLPGVGRAGRRHAQKKRRIVVAIEGERLARRQSSRSSRAGPDAARRGASATLASPRNPPWPAPRSSGLRDAESLRRRSSSRETEKRAGPAPARKPPREEQSARTANDRSDFEQEGALARKTAVLRLSY